MDPLLEKFQTLRSRWVLVRSMQIALVLLPLAWVLGLLTALGLHFAGAGRLGALEGILLPSLAALLVSVIWAKWTCPEPTQIALLADRALGTKDRLITAWRLTNQNPDGITALALKDCREAVRKAEGKRAFPPPSLHGRWMLATPLVAFLLVQWIPGPQKALPLAPPDPADAAVAEDAAEAMEKLSGELAAAPLPPELEKWLAELKESARRLKEDAARPGSEPRKEALKEFSSLEQMLEAIRNQQERPRISPEELAALAEALASTEEGKKAADALREGRTADAAAELEKLAEALGRGEEGAKKLEQLAEAAGEAAAGLDEAARNEVAEQMRQAAESSQPSEAMKELMQELSDLMREMAAQQGNKPGEPRQNDGSQEPQSQQQAALDEETLKRLIETLRQMKEQANNGDGKEPGSPQKQPGEGEPGDQEGEMSISLDFGDGESGESSGAPGSELDKGEGTTPDQMAETSVTPEGPASRLSGTPGEGERLSQNTRTAGETAGSARTPYRAQLESARATMEETLGQEEIPLGSRVYIRRYFEMIRPSE